MIGKTHYPTWTKQIPCLNWCCRYGGPLNLNMVRKKGFETLAEIRGITKFRNLPVIILTTSSDEGDKIQSQRLGADGFLTKPHSNEDTVAMLKLLALEWL